jgi:thiol-disulfide isomerase/thioredoxin
MRYSKVIRWGSLLSFVLVVACGQDSSAPQSDGAASGGGSEPGITKLEGSTDSPNYAFVDLDGNKGSLADYKGKVLIVDVWATWCPPCKQELPHFIELYDEYKDKGFEMVGLSVDDSPDVLKPFIKEYNLNYTIHWGNGQEVQSVFGPIPGIPTTFIIDKEGNIVKKLVGYQDKAVFEDAIKSLL